MTDYKCPVCGKAPSSLEARIETQKAVNEYSPNGFGFLCNPGGGEFTFKDKCGIQISYCCDWCDLDKVKKAINLRGGKAA